MQSIEHHIDMLSVMGRGSGASRVEGGLFGSSPGHLDHNAVDHAGQRSSGSQ